MSDNDVTIENFIATFDNAFDEGFCDFVIEYFEKMNEMGFTQERSALEKISSLSKDDSFMFMNNVHGVKHTTEIAKHFNQVFWDNVYPIYYDKFQILKDYEKHSIMTNKIQKTKIGQGYHMWHSESSRRVDSDRILVFTVYLNDVAEGGETEFLYYPKRVASKQGRVLIFPAGFTHTHRGNPPISNNKYIMTGWVEY